MNKDDYEFLCECVLYYYKTGIDNNNLINYWHYQEDAFDKARFLLKNSDIPEKLTHFAILSLENLINIWFILWDENFFQELNDELINLLKTQTDRFINDFLLKAFCRMYGVFVRIAWNKSFQLANTIVPNISHVFSDFDDDIYRIIEQELYIGILDRMLVVKFVKSKQNEYFKEKALPFFLEKSFAIFKKAHEKKDANESLISHSLDFTLKIYEYYLSKPKKPYNRYQRSLDDINIDWENMNSLIELMFFFYEKYGETVQNKALKVILKFNPRVSDKKLVNMYYKIINIIDNNINLNHVSNLKILCKIISKLKFNNSNNNDMEGKSNFSRYLHSVNRLSINLLDTKFYVENYVYYNKLLEFWVIDDNSKRNTEYQKHYEILYEKLIRFFIGLIETNPDFVKSLYFTIDSPSSKTKDNLISNISNIGSYDPNNIQECIDEAYNMFQLNTNEVNVLKICFLTELILNNLILYISVHYNDKDKQSRRMDCFYSIKFLLDFIRRVTQSVASNEPISILFEYTVFKVLDVLHLNKTSDKIFSMIHESDISFFGLDSLNNYFEICFIRIKQVFNTYAVRDTALISNYIKVLKLFFKEKSDIKNYFLFTPQISKVDIFLNIFDLDNFLTKDPFLQLNEDYYNRHDFYVLLSTIYFSDKKKKLTIFNSMKAYISNLDETSDIKNLIIDITGLFAGTETRQSYREIFDKFFPDDINRIIDVACQFPDLILLLIQMIKEIVTNKHSRIYFDQHSDLGLLLFKVTAHFLITFFTSEYIENLSLDKNNDIFAISFEIMTTIVTSSDLCIGALIAYEDPILIGLITSFLDLLRSKNTNDLFNLTKLLNNTIELMSALFEQFPYEIFRYQMQFNFKIFNLSLEMVRKCIDDSNYESNNSDKSFKLIEYITYFLVQNKENDEIKEDILQLIDELLPTYNDILKILELFIYKEQILQTRYTEAVKIIDSIQPPGLFSIKNRLKLYFNEIPESEKKNLNEILDIFTTDDEE